MTLVDHVTAISLLARILIRFLTLPVKEFLIHMAKAHPIFGFAREAEERERRNRITAKLHINTIES